MTGPDVSDVREQLAVLLDNVSPSAAPVASVLAGAAARRRSVRLRTGAGAVIAVVAVTVGAVLAGQSAPGKPDGAASHGESPQRSVVVGSGTIAGRPWKVVVDGPDGRLCAGVTGLHASCVPLAGLQTQGGIAGLSGTRVAVPSTAVLNGPPVWNAVFGIVQRGVTSLVIKAGPGKQTFTMRPVWAAGYRWVGVIMPAGTAPSEAIAYAGHTELAHSVPFIGGELNEGTYFVTWLKPGRSGTTVSSRYIGGSHGWYALVQAGQWGFCVILQIPDSPDAEQRCLTADSVSSAPKVIMESASPPVAPRWLVGTATPDVAYLRLSLAGGGSVRVRVPLVSGQRFYALRIGPGEKVTGWGAFDAAGHRLYGGRGAPDAAS